MSMKMNNKRLTVCEVLRMVNDLHQDSRNRHDVEVQRLLAVAEAMAKKMSHKLLAYNMEWEKEFYRDNPKHAGNVRRALGKKYTAYHLTDADRKEFGI